MLLILFSVLGGRTYPLEGAMVPIPQHYPYTDPLEILICGGSTVGPSYALDNCVRGAPEATNMEWTLERMVSTFQRFDILFLTCLIAITSCYALYDLLA